MKQFILAFFILTLAGCTKKEWTKDSLTNDCLRDFKKRNDEEKIFDPAKLPYMCDCITDKLLAKYKSAAESEKDEEGGVMIGRDCAIEVLKK